MEGLEDQSQHSRDTTMNPNSQTTAVSSVPPEILLKIFFLLLPEISVFSPSTRAIRQDPARSVSQVSKIWRDTALSSPIFWSQTLNWNHCPEKWFKILLERSGSQDLHIVADLTVPGYSRSLAEIPNLLRRNIDAIQHAERVKSLQVHVKITFERRIPDIVFELKSHAPLSHLPALERIDLVNTAKPSHIYRSAIDRGLLSEAESANLRVLRVSGLSVNFDLPYRNIQVLSAIDLAPEGNPHITKWLRILQGMPNLVDLTLKGSFGDELAEGRGGPVNVYLPKLTTLSLAGQILHPFGIETFLSHISPAHGCNLYFAGWFGYLNPQNSSTIEYLSTMQDAFKRWFKRWNCEDYKSTELHTCLDAKRFIIHNQSGEKPWPGSYFRISIGLEHSMMRQLSQSDVIVISAISQSLVLTLDDAIKRTQDLTVWSTPRAFVMPWKDFLSRFLSVTTLRITERKEQRCHSDHGGGVRTINAIFSELTATVQTSEDQLTPALLPSLRKVTIVKLGGQVVTFDYADFLGHFQTEGLQFRDGVTPIYEAIARSAASS